MVDPDDTEGEEDAPVPSESREGDAGDATPRGGLGQGHGDYWSRSGERLTLHEFGALLEDQTYKRVEETTLDNGVWISTVWLGLCHRFMGKGPPLIFETMVFLPPPETRKVLKLLGSSYEVQLGQDVYQTRSTTEGLARAEHEKAVEWARHQDFELPDTESDDS